VMIIGWLRRSKRIRNDWWSFEKKIK
jgi:hypothetical protein